MKTEDKVYVVDLICSFLVGVTLTLALFFCVGCAAQPRLPPDRQLAVETVWVHAYERGEPMPRTIWREPHLLTCGASTGRQDIGWDTDPGPEVLCVGGLFWLSTWTAEIAAPTETPIHKMALAHEFNHARLYLIGVGDEGNGNHKHPSWGPGGEVEMANAMLEAIGQ